MVSSAAPMVRVGRSAWAIFDAAQDIGAEGGDALTGEADGNANDQWVARGNDDFLGVGQRNE